MLFYINIILFNISLFLLSFKYIFIKYYGNKQIKNVFKEAFFNNISIEIRVIFIILIAIFICIIISIALYKLYRYILNYNFIFEYTYFKKRKKIIIKKIYEKIFLFFTIIIFIFSYNYKIKTINFFKDILKYVYINHQIKYKYNNELIYPLIAHAGGGIGGKAYTNSFESLYENYQLGHRYFEIDLLLMPDKNILCAHDIHHLNSITNTLEQYLSSDDYKKKNIYGKYTIIDLEELFKFMSKHEDMFIITDSKLAGEIIGYKSNDDYNESFWGKFIEIAKNVDSSILNRIIPQIYYPEMLTIINKYYKFDNYIFTLYVTSLDDESIIKFVYENPTIYYITMPPNRVENREFIFKLQKLNRKIFIHTINDIDEMIYYRKKGVYGFYTDFIFPSQIKDIL
jgi:glycerophosphoryl diester phosphodiesterase